MRTATDSLHGHQTRVLRAYGAGEVRFSASDVKLSQAAEQLVRELNGGYSTPASTSAPAGGGPHTAESAALN